MKRILGILCLLVATVAVRGQITPIPWHPQMPSPAPRIPKGAKAGTGKPAEKTPSKFHMTFDKVTTLKPGVYYAEGDVRFSYQGMFLTADAVTYDTNKGTIWATGRVAVDFQDFTASGSELNYDLKKGTGTLMDAYGVQKNGDFTVYGKAIKKIGDGWFEVIDGTFTSCAAAVPPWSMKVTRAKFHVDHYAYLTNPRFHIRQAPIVYLPYLIWPIKPERSTGLLIPEIGNSTSKGFTMNNALFIAPTNWWDDTVYLDTFSTMGVGVGEEFRYVPSTSTYGWFHGYYIKQKTNDKKRWDFTWTHIQNFRKGWYFVADVNLLSDINFPRDYQRDFYKGTVSGTDSRIFLVRNWGPYSFTTQLERRLQYFTEDRDLTQKTLPGVELRSSLQPLGHGLYFGFDTSVDAFQKEYADYVPQPVKHSLTYQRVDLHPFFEWPLHPALWLDVTPRLELRATGYTSSLDPATNEYDAGSLWRNYAHFSLDVTGPRLFRKYAGGMKHVVEPFITYTYVSRDARALHAPVFDSVDQVVLDQNLVRYGVRNRLYGRKGRLVLDSSLYQESSFGRGLSVQGDNASRFSPVTLLVRAWPTVNWSSDLRLRYDILNHALASQSLSVTYHPKKSKSDDFISLSYLKTQDLSVSQYDSQSLNPAAKELRFAGSITLADGRVSVTPYLERDLQKGDWRNQRLIFWYRGSCYAIGFEAGRRTIGPFRDSQYRFLVSLKGAGTVVDLQGATGNY